MQLFHVSITFVAQKLVVTAQFEKKWILPLLFSMANSLVFSSLKKALFSKKSKISFWRIRLESGSKVFKCKMLEFSPNIHTKWRVLTSWWLSSIMGPWRSIRVLFQRNHEKQSFCSFFKNTLFFNLSWGIQFLGYESDQYVKKLHFFSIFGIYQFYMILTTFDLVLSRKRTQQILPFSTFQKSKFQYWASKGGQKWRKVKFSIFPPIYIKKRVFWYLDHSVAPAELGEQFGPKSSKSSKNARFAIFSFKQGGRDHAQVISYIFFILCCKNWCIAFEPKTDPPMPIIL